jgi:putative endonuclease
VEKMLGILLDRLRDEARTRTGNQEHAVGSRGEDLAHRYLQENGYTIVARNYRLSSGDAEADIIAWDGDALVFVEVKTRSDLEFGPPERAISETKRRHLLRVAREYTRKASVDWNCVRFDVVTVVASNPPILVLLRGAMDTKSTPQHDLIPA